MVKIHNGVYNNNNNNKNQKTEVPTLILFKCLSFNPFGCFAYFCRMPSKTSKIFDSKKLINGSLSALYQLTNTNLYKAINSELLLKIHCHSKTRYFS